MCSLRKCVLEKHCLETPAYPGGDDVSETRYVQAATRKIDDGGSPHRHSRMETSFLTKSVTKSCFVIVWAPIASHLSTPSTPCEANFNTEVTGGLDIIKKCIASLTSGTALERLAVIDAHGYDASPALAVLEASKFF